jgi:GSCFA family
VCAAEGRKGNVYTGRVSLLERDKDRKRRRRAAEFGRLSQTDDYGGWAKRRWHALGAQRHPRDIRLFRGDLRPLIRDYVLPGHTPAEPMLSADDAVITLGSCFARELQDYLVQLGYASETLWIPAGLHNSFAMLDFLSWAVTGEETDRGFRYDILDGEIREWTPEGERELYEERLAGAGAFVFTFGLAEVWEDRETGGVFWRGVPEEIFDLDRHVFRLSSVEENEANIVRIVELVRSVNPDAPIVLTLSPVPLAATFRPISCITADAVSKSTLRLALDRVETRGLPGVYYWPSFEIVRWVGAHLDWPAYGVPDGVTSHASRYLVGAIIESFVESFYVPEAVADMRSRRPQAPVPAPWSLGGRLLRLRYDVERKRRAFKRSPRGKAVARRTKQARRTSRRSWRAVYGRVRGARPS